MTRRGGSLAGILAVGAALVVALLAGLSEDGDPRAPPVAARVRIGVYDPRAMPRRPVVVPAAALAAIARRADLAAITAQADFRSDRVELVDVTCDVAAALRSHDAGPEKSR